MLQNVSEVGRMPKSGILVPTLCLTNKPAGRFVKSPKKEFTKSLPPSIEFLTIAAYCATILRMRSSKAV